MGSNQTWHSVGDLFLFTASVWISDILRPFDLYVSSNPHPPLFVLQWTCTFANTSVVSPFLLLSIRLNSPVWTSGLPPTSPVALIPRGMPVLASSPARNVILWTGASPFWLLSGGTGGSSEWAQFNDVSLLPTAEALHGLLFRVSLPLFSFSASPSRSPGPWCCVDVFLSPSVRWQDLSKLLLSKLFFYAIFPLLYNLYMYFLY